jgi:hypothetical protein
MTSRVGILNVIQRLPGSKFLCKCDCGNEKVVGVGHFNVGQYKSCGCINHHGHAGNGKRTREYIAYHNMITRCHKPKNKRFKDYGAKGILVCNTWRESFKNFLSDMGPCPPGCQIDRIDNNSGYSPENCRWITPKENMANRSISRIWIIDGREFRSTTDASKEFSVSAHTIRAWCLGRHAEGRYYPPKSSCGTKPLGQFPKYTRGQPA